MVGLVALERGALERERRMLARKARSALTSIEQQILATAWQEYATAANLEDFLLNLGRVISRPRHIKLLDLVAPLVLPKHRDAFDVERRIWQFATNPPCRFDQLLQLDGAQAGQLLVVTLRRSSTRLPLGFSVNIHQHLPIVTRVDLGSPAAAAGLREGDVLLVLNQARLAGTSRATAAEHLKHLLATCKKTVRLLILPSGAAARASATRASVAAPQKNTSSQKLATKPATRPALADLGNRQTSPTKAGPRTHDDWASPAPSARSAASKGSSAAASHTSTTPNHDIVIPVLSGQALGFNIAGGAEYQRPLIVSHVHRNSLAYAAGLRTGQEIVTVNGASTSGILHSVAVQLIREREHLRLQVRRRFRPTSNDAPTNAPAAHSSQSQPQQAPKSASSSRPVSPSRLALGSSSHTSHDRAKLPVTRVAPAAPGHTSPRHIVPSPTRSTQRLRVRIPGLSRTRGQHHISSGPRSPVRQASPLRGASPRRSRQARMQHYLLPSPMSSASSRGSSGPRLHRARHMAANMLALPGSMTNHSPIRHRVDFDESFSPTRTVGAVRLNLTPSPPRQAPPPPPLAMSFLEPDDRDAFSDSDFSDFEPMGESETDPHSPAPGPALPAPGRTASVPPAPPAPAPPAPAPAPRLSSRQPLVQPKASGPAQHDLLDQIRGFKRQALRPPMESKLEEPATQSANPLMAELQLAQARRRYAGASIALAGPTSATASPEPSGVQRRPLAQGGQKTMAPKVRASQVVPDQLPAPTLSAATSISASVVPAQKGKHEDAPVSATDVAPQRVALRPPPVLKPSPAASTSAASQTRKQPPPPPPRVRSRSGSLSQPLTPTTHNITPCAGPMSAARRTPTPSAPPPPPPRVRTQVAPQAPPAAAVLPSSQGAQARHVNVYTAPPAPPVPPAPPAPPMPRTMASGKQGSSSLTVDLQGFDRQNLQPVGQQAARPVSMRDQVLQTIADFDTTRLRPAPAPQAPMSAPRDQVLTAIRAFSTSSLRKAPVVAPAASRDPHSTLMTAIRAAAELHPLKQVSSPAKDAQTSSTPQLSPHETVLLELRHGRHQLKATNLQAVQSRPRSPRSSVLTDIRDFQYNSLRRPTTPVRVPVSPKAGLVSSFNAALAEKFKNCRSPRPGAAHTDAWDVTSSP
ncbi:uncharacterized protein MONBRDRAFT_5536 [Monosiga brevicollis MX1]|uniref:PDZ domain-containing protein n=1 Tax=Monosiga brevicollis TaxID=81824 RepID=A9URR3_MONBE|nr:uncharacterized protein MONBRDRAFT_5536 [Monosiga brevicollis MX1]EDQ91971.1 predicted protein [Monosiga brevicollis MX1]|eukprot:XP_001743257.1 hypothetical protein [Monosiga brevicollis MX1]